MNASCRTPAVSLLAGLALSSGCHGGSGGGTSQDFEVTGMDVLTAAPELSHEISVVVELSAADSAADVSLTFLVAPRAEVDAGVPDPPLEVVDTETIARVDAGSNLYEVRLDLPEDTIAPGEYYLIAVVDPLDAMAETDEADNEIAADGIPEFGALVVLGGTQQFLPDIVLESIEVDDPVVETDVTPEVSPPVGGIPEVENSDFGITATVRSTGPDTLVDVALGASLEVPMPTGALVLPLVIWDTDSGAYTSTIDIPFLVATESHSIHLDVRIPQDGRDVLAALLPAGEELLLEGRVHVDVDPSNMYPEYEGGNDLQGDEDGNDNGETARVLLIVFEDEEAEGLLAGEEEPNELEWDVPYLKDFSNGNAGVGVRFGAKASVNTKGVLAEAEASVPMTLVGFTIDLLNLDAKGLFNPRDKADNGFVVTLKALDLKLYEKRTKEDEELSGDPLAYHQEKAYSATFTVGPVPMSVRIGASGTVGLDVSASVGSEFRVAAEPKLNFAVFGEGGVGGSFAGWTLAGGLGADMELIDDTFSASITASVDYDSGTSILTGSITEAVTNQLEGPNGRLFVFATAQGKILWSRVSKRWEYVLAKWASFERNDTLFNKTESVSVLIQ